LFFIPLKHRMPIRFVNTRLFATNERKTRRHCCRRVFLFTLLRATTELEVEDRFRFDPVVVTGTRESSRGSGRAGREVDVVIDVLDAEIDLRHRAPNQVGRDAPVRGLEHVAGHDRIRKQVPVDADVIVASAQGRPQRVGPEVLIRAVDTPFGRQISTAPAAVDEIALRTGTDLNAGVARVTDIMVDALTREHATLQGVLAPGVDVTGQVEAVTDLFIVRHRGRRGASSRTVDLAIHEQVMQQAGQRDMAPGLIQADLEDDVRPRGAAADGAGGERFRRAPHAATDSPGKELVREVADRGIRDTGGERLFQRTGDAPAARTFPGVADRGLQTTQLTGESQRLTH